MPLSPGTTLGPYAVTAKIGEGGMGEVYRARDTKLDRDVALKVLPQAFTDDPDRLVRFEREAKVLASLNHPNIGHIYGLEEAEGQKALVLELVEGPTLADRIKQGPIPVDEALPIAKQIAEALEAAHEQGVIHRDLKPANVKVRPDGMVKVLDFGLAKAFQLDPSGQQTSDLTTVTEEATKRGLILGTPSYMSPEQARGQPAGKSADVWAFGCVLFEMLSGRRPFLGETTTDKLAAIIGQEPDWQTLPFGTPARLVTLMRRCLRKEHARRQRDLGDAGMDLDELRDSPDDAAELTIGTASRATDRRPLAWALVGLGAGVVLAILASSTSFSPNHAPSTVTRLLLSLAPTDTIPMGNNAPNIAISRDGRWLAYGGGGTVGRDSELYLRNLAEGEARAIAGTVGAAYPFFSPDGQWVAYFDFVEGQLKKVSVTGGTPITLCPAPGARGGSWGENGMIVLASPSRAALSQVSEDGGTPEPATALDTDRGETSHRQPRLLPGGEAVLFKAEGTSRADSQVWAQSLTSGERHRLVANAEFATYSSTGHLLYVQDGNLIAAPFDPEALELQGPAVTVIDDSRGTVRQFALSEAGMLVYAAGDPSSSGRNLMWVDRATGEAEPLGAPPLGYNHAHLSPDGERIVASFAQQRVGIFDISSGVFEPLVVDGAASWPVWTADGREVTYASNQEGTAWDIFQRPWDGTGAERPLLVRERLQAPKAWSPDGTTLAFTDLDLAADIWLLTVDNEDPTRPWLRTPAIEHQPQFSPDGHWIAYSSNESGDFEVYVQPVTGGVKRAISASGGREPRWSRDGRELFYRSGDGMYRVEVSLGSDGAFERGRSSLLFSGPYQGDTTGNAAYDVASDASRFLMISRAESGSTEMQLNVVLNWHQELLERVPVN